MLKFPFGEQQDNSFQDYKVTFTRAHASAIRGRLIRRRVIVSYLPTVPHSTGLSRSAAQRRVQLTTLTAPADTSAGAVARLAPRSSCCSPSRMPMKRDRTRHFRYTVHQPGTAPTHIGIIYRATQTLTGSPRILVFIRGRLPVMLVWLDREPVDCQH